MAVGAAADRVPDRKRKLKRPKHGGREVIRIEYGRPDLVPCEPAPPERFSDEPASRKKARRRTDDGLALHSLDTLLAKLATRYRNTCRVLSDPTAPPFSLLTEPTQTQRRVADLIEMFPGSGTA